MAALPDTFGPLENLNDWDMDDPEAARILADVAFTPEELGGRTPEQAYRILARGGSVGFAAHLNQEWEDYSEDGVLTISLRLYLAEVPGATQDEALGHLRSLAEHFGAALAE